jgi:hypothetical protein
VGLSFSRDGKALASACLGGAIKVWDVRSGKESASFKEVGSLAFSPDGKTVASAQGSLGDWTVKLWKVSGKGHRVLKLKVIRDYLVGGLAFAPDGRTLAVVGMGRTGRVSVWDTVARKERLCIIGDTSFIRAVTFSPDGLLLAGAQWEDVTLWDVASGNARSTLKGHTGDVVSIAFAAGGKLLATCSHKDGTIKLWDLPKGKVRLTLKHPQCNNIALSKDGKLLASGGNDSTLKLWDAASGKELKALKPGGPVWMVALAPDGRVLAASIEDTVRIWDVASLLKR